MADKGYGGLVAEPRKTQKRGHETQRPRYLWPRWGSVFRVCKKRSLWVLATERFRLRRSHLKLQAFGTGSRGGIAQCAPFLRFGSTNRILGTKGSTIKSCQIGRVHCSKEAVESHDFISAAELIVSPKIV